MPKSFKTGTCTVDYQNTGTDACSFDFGLLQHFIHAPSNHKITEADLNSGLFTFIQSACRAVNPANRLYPVKNIKAVEGANTESTTEEIDGVPYYPAGGEGKKVYNGALIRPSLAYAELQRSWNGRSEYWGYGVDDKGKLLCNENEDGSVGPVLFEVFNFAVMQMETRSAVSRVPLTIVMSNNNKLVTIQDTEANWNNLKGLVNLMVSAGDVSIAGAAISARIVNQLSRTPLAIFNPVAATAVPIVSLKVNGTTTTATRSINGDKVVFTLASAPAVGSVIDFTFGDVSVLQTAGLVNYEGINFSFKVP